MVGGTGSIGLLDQLHRPRTGPVGMVDREGRRATGRLLDALLPEGFEIIHALSWSEPRLDAEHLVVGPTGVWSVESRDFPYRLSVGRRGTLYSGFTPVTAVVAEAVQRAQVASEALGAQVGAVVAVRPPVIPERQLRHAGAHLTDLRALLPLLRQSPEALSPTEVDVVAGTARALAS